MELTLPWIEPRRFGSAAFAHYRMRMIFDACKWDPRVEDEDTIADFAITLRRQEWGKLTQLAEALDRELREAEAGLWAQPPLFAELGMPPPLTRALQKLACRDSPPHGILVRRYDFHFTTDGWQISEVNADVPGGFSEASLVPHLAIEAGAVGKPPGDVAETLALSILDALADQPPGLVALVHATAYSDDRQVMVFLERLLRSHGLEAAPAAPDHLDWSDRSGTIRAHLNGREVAAVLRFFPAEWLPALGGTVPWQHYLGGQAVGPLLCSPGAAVLAQSKRLPLLWRRLGLSLPTWEKLLPECAEPALNHDAAWLHKPAFGRVGDSILAPGWVAEAAKRNLERSIRRDPGQWIRQRRFETLPMTLADGERFYPCFGVFVVNGRCSGVYGRVSRTPLVDHRAMDVPVLVEDDSMLSRCGEDSFDPHPIAITP